jgi:hypothetical protein
LTSRTKAGKDVPILISKFLVSDNVRISMIVSERFCRFIYGCTSQLHGGVLQNNKERENILIGGENS